MKKNRRLSDSYKFPGFRAYQKVKRFFGDQKSLIITMKRVEKKQYVQSVVNVQKVFMTKKPDWYGTYPVETNRFTLNWKYVVSIVGCARK